MSNKKKAIIGIIIGLIVIFISFIAVLLFTSLLFDGKYNLLKEKPVIIEKNGKTPVNNKTVENQSYHIYDLVKEQSGKDIKDLFKDAKTDWVYAEYDENASDTSDFTVVIIGTYKINNEERLSIGILDENKYGIVDGDFEKENVSIEYGKYTYDIKILSEQEISLKRNNEAEKILKLVEKKVSWRISKHNNIVKYYEETIEKLNNNSELSDKETLKVLAFALVYLDVEKSNKEAIIPDIGYNLAISKERINELLKELVCSGKYQIKDFNNFSKIGSEPYSLSDESFTGTKEEFSEMYVVSILPSGMENTGSIVLFSTANTNYYKINNFTYKNDKNTMQRIVVKTKTIDGHKCLDY